MTPTVYRPRPLRLASLAALVLGVALATPAAASTWSTGMAGSHSVRCPMAV